MDFMPFQMYRLCLFVCDSAKEKEIRKTKKKIRLQIDFFVNIFVISK